MPLSPMRRPRPMAKTAIYFDVRERDLARRALTFVVEQLREATRQNINEVQSLATKWTTVEILTLVSKFDEPQEPDE